MDAENHLEVRSLIEKLEEAVTHFELAERGGVDRNRLDELR